MAKLTDEARRAITEIEKGEFRCQKAAARRGTYRGFAPLPQHHYATRYMPIDTTILHRLLSLCWRKHGYPDGVEKHLSEAKFRAEEAKWWSHVFRLKELEGVVAAGASVLEDEEQRSAKRRFGFFMMTDGVACSFYYYRPKRAAASAPRHTPETVHVEPGITKVVSIDPGMRAIATGAELVLIWDEVDTDEKDGKDGQGM